VGEGAGVAVEVVVGEGLGVGSALLLHATSPNAKEAAKDKLSRGFKEFFIILNLSGLSCFFGV
jgi:hypothetical protein